MQRATLKNPKAQKTIPDKLFYKIGEVSKVAGVEPYVLRYWESEFPFLKPRKSKSGQRIYVKKDLELILQIKRLLYKERFTIEGVRKKLGEGSSLKKPSVSDTVPTPGTIEYVKSRLREILNSIK